MPMRIFELENNEYFNKPIFVFGSFETFHLGHNQLFLAAKEIKKQNYERDIVLVYFADVENLPKNMNKGIFTNLNYRIQKMANLGFLNAIELNFKNIYNLEAEDFIKKLTYKYDEFTLVIGEDFKFGYKGKGNTTFLKENFPNNTFIVKELKLENGNKISTSFIKECLLSGEIDLVNTLNMYKYGFDVSLNEKDDLIHISKVDNKLVSLKKGIYIAFLELNDYVYYVVYLNGNNKQIIKSLDYDLHLVDNFLGKIEILEKIRILVTNEKEEIDENDLFLAKNYFIKLNKNS
ncbi:FAD synthase [Mycoplasmopsis meleagridis]|uniref:FAD synthase n=1 Tax=Mycoplasmopsis meleagridis TaxID=29561 RepID=UPI00073D6D57|nr:hypothetical protein [Mycoplasmopsis meleagridis]KUH47268.1 hypothetical protein ASB56_02510 [Mycoplasmopsis meleagridis]